MHIKINNSNNNKIIVTIKATPKKNDDDTYIIYLLFNLYWNGINYSKTELSTGERVPKRFWSQGKMIGKTEKSRIVNENIECYMSSAKYELEEARKRLMTPLEVLDHIKNHVKPVIFGKPALGKKEDTQKELSNYSVDSVLKKFLGRKKQCEERQKKISYSNR